MRARQMLSMHRVGMTIALVLAWLALWRDASIANALSGVIVAVAAVSLVGRGGDAGVVRPLPLCRFASKVSVDLVWSTISVVREVLTPTDRTDEAIIRVPIPSVDERHLLLLYLAVTVTPGTAVVAADDDRSALYLHVLHKDRREMIEHHVRDLADLALAALPGRAVDRSQMTERTPGSRPGSQGVGS